MNTDRIKEIQADTCVPDSVSVQQALLKVWNEVEQQIEEKYKLKESSFDRQTAINKMLEGIKVLPLSYIRKNVDCYCFYDRDNLNTPWRYLEKGKHETAMINQWRYFLWIEID